MLPSRLAIGLLSAFVVLGPCRVASANETAVGTPRTGPTPPPYPATGWDPSMAPPTYLPYSAASSLGAPVLFPYDPRLPLVSLRVNRWNARLQLLAGDRWQDVCFSLCNLSLSPTATYRVGGGAAMNSEAFSIPDRSGQVYVDARGGSKVGYWTGVSISIGGAVLSAMGASLLVAGASMSKDDPMSVHGENPTRGEVLGFGAAVLITVAIVGLVGLGIWHRNKMKVEVH